MSASLFGVRVPEPLIARLHGADDQRAEGRAISVELMQRRAHMNGVAGVHLMAPKQEEACARSPTPACSRFGADRRGSRARGRGR